MNDPSLRILGAVLALVLPMLSACGGDTGDAAPDDRAAAALPSGLFVASAPSGAVGVREAVSSAKAGQDVVVRGVVGGRRKAFVDGRAVLVVVEPALKPCPPDEGCPTPWDYCCETPDTLLANTMTVQVVGADGAPIERSLRGVQSLAELTTIVVAGKVRSAEGSLIVDADRIHVVDG